LKKHHRKKCLVWTLTILINWIISSHHHYPNLWPRICSSSKPCSCICHITQHPSHKYEIETHCYAAIYRTCHWCSLAKLANFIINNINWTVSYVQYLCFTKGLIMSLWLTIGFIYVTRFVKRGLQHTSNFPSLTIHDFPSK